jgi:hypothetical protein
MMSSTTSVNVTGYFIGNLARSNSELLDIAKRLRDIAAEVPDKRLQERFAAEINRILDLAERNDQAVRSVIPVG